MRTFRGIPDETVSNLDSPYETDKYEKETKIRDRQKQMEFQVQDIGMLKILNLAVLALGSLNFVFSVTAMQHFRLTQSSYFPSSMLALVCVSIFGQIALSRVDQKVEKHSFCQLSGNFSFEALYIYFRCILILTPLMLYLAIQTLFTSEIYSA